jgi:succinoglycan biosynthesis transport protein ExoP
MSSFDTSDWGRSVDSLPGGPLGSVTERANRRRLIVFLGVFCVACAAGLAYDFLRPAEYRATSRLQITPASYVAPNDAPTVPGGAAPAAPSDPERPFLTEVQKLSSRPLLERVAKRLGEAGQDMSALGPDPVAALQSVLTVTPVPGTHVVELVATGAHPELPAALLVAISEAYRNEIARSFEAHSAEATARADDEVHRLEAAVTAKRRAVEEYRLRYNIVSPEREENEALAQLQGLGKSLQAAGDRVSAAEGKVSALREAMATGKGVVRAKDNPTLANLEQRASQAREDLRNLERTYTPDYLAIDPNARALRARLAAQEEQIKAQRAASQQAALAEAEEELASAREAQRRLRAQIAAGRQGAGQFAARFDQYKALRSELEQLESTYRDAQQRRAKLEATERARVPSVQILEQAALPREPWRPRYWRDAAIVVAGALLLALLAMALVELFNRPEPGPAVVLAQPVIGGALLQGLRQPLGLEAAAPPALGATERPLLGRPAAMPRELSAEEMHSLLRAAERDTQLLILLLLSGISPEEALALRWRDVERGGAVAHVGGARARTVRLNAVAARYLAAASGSPDAPVLADAAGQPATPESLSTQLLYAAHDARLERVDEITPNALRHTYIAFLVRQGVRFADLAQVVGQLPAATLAAYSALAPAGARLARESVNLVYPGLENLQGE